MITAIFIGGPWDGERRQLPGPQAMYTVAVARHPVMLPPSAAAELVVSDTYVYREYRPLEFMGLTVFIPDDLEGDPWVYLVEQLLIGYRGVPSNTEGLAL